MPLREENHSSGVQSAALSRGQQLLPEWHALSRAAVSEPGILPFAIVAVGHRIIPVLTTPAKVRMVMR